MVVDHAKAMLKEPGTRPICAVLSDEMLQSLQAGRSCGPGSTKGLKARRLWKPGAPGATTPMGEQIRRMLLDKARMRRALISAREMVKGGASAEDVLEVISGGLLAE